MPAAARPVNEIERLRELHELDILDTPPEQQLDDIARFTATLLDVPIALVSLVDEERQWFKAKIGLDADETPRDASFCAHAILSSNVLVVHDALEDPRFADSPLVIGPPHIRFYAGSPLRTPSGHTLGTLCVIDGRPRPHFGDAEAKHLRSLANLVEQHLSLRWSAQRLAAELQERQDLISGFEQERAACELRLRSKREFLAKAAHEFRTPLNSVQACAAMLRDEIHGPHSNPRYRNYAEIILDAAAYMESLAGGLLDYARARSEQFQLDCSEVDLAGVLRESLDLMQANANIAKIELRYDIAAARRPVKADRLRLKQVFLNLLSNALKFTPQGGAIAIDAQRPEFGMLTVTVSDTGVGIAPDEIGRAFAPFGQTSAKSQNGQRGTGLGLSIAKLIVERHGGMLTLASELGRGTTATVRLPCI